MQEFLSILSPLFPTELNNFLGNYELLDPKVRVKIDEIIVKLIVYVVTTAPLLLSQAGSNLTTAIFKISKGLKFEDSTEESPDQDTINLNMFADNMVVYTDSMAELINELTNLKEDQLSKESDLPEGMRF